jgi:hypothetical protein
MNWVNDRELARRFQDNSVPSRERMYYYLATQVIISIVMSQTFLSWSESESLYVPLSTELIITDTISLLFGIAVIYALYCINKQGDDKEFIERIVCISWPVTMQFICIIIIYILFNIVTYLLFGDILLFFFDTSMGSMLLFCIFYAYFYWRMHYGLRIASASGA